jgi:hypothetical protein
MNRFSPTRSVVSALSVLSSCVPAEPALPGPASTEASMALDVPATYAMGRGCGAETGGEVSLSLLENQLAVLRQVHSDSSCAHQVTTLFLGRWNVEPDGRRLTLDTGPSWLRRLDIVNRQTLRLVDSPGAEASSASHPSTPPDRLVPFSRPFELRDPVLFAHGLPFPILYSPAP